MSQLTNPNLDIEENEPRCPSCKSSHVRPFLWLKVTACLVCKTVDPEYKFTEY